MNLSLNEVEVMGKRAARGAGYSWGMAEEAGRAVHWLCASGIDGVSVLASVLVHADGQDMAELAPRMLSGDWCANKVDLCPLLAGTALSDSASFWMAGGKRIQDLAAPVMILPFLASAARELGTKVTAEWENARAVTDGFAAALTLRDARVLTEPSSLVIVSAGGELDDPLAPQYRAKPDAAAWTVLKRFAGRTYAPDTEGSRLKGAGAGLTDND